jgi:hypothetical protein
VTFQAEKDCEAAALDVLHNKCAVHDVFADSRFLKQEALQVGALFGWWWCNLLQQMAVDEGGWFGALDSLGCRIGKP